MSRVYGKNLARKWGLQVKHALYRESGDWYHQLKDFPGALLDVDGYVEFETEEAFRSCPHLQIRQDVSVREGIKKIPGYVRIMMKGKKQPDTLLQRTTYESAMGAQEGAVLEVTLNRYERDPEARQACLKHYGLACAVCEMTFGDVYGDIGRDFIHVHHLDQLAMGGERKTDPIEHLRPVCPNCHAMLHKRTPPVSIPELRKMLRSVSISNGD